MNNASPSRKSPALPFSFCARALGVVLLLGCSVASSFAASSFTGLGVLPGDSESHCSGVSDDGKIVVGTSRSEKRSQAFFWMANRGLVALGHLPGDTNSVASAISGDGKIIVGASAKYDNLNDAKPFRWSAAEGFTRLSPPDALFISVASGVSADGSVVVGECVCFTEADGVGAPLHKAFRWTAASGMVFLGSLEKKGRCTAYGVSRDGSVVIGECESPAGLEAFLWTQAKGLVGLGDLRAGDHWSRANAISGDGKVIVGFGHTSPASSDQLAFRWTSASGIVALGKLPGTTSSDAVGISLDGSIVVGHSSGTTPMESQATIWDSVNGMRSIQFVLTNDCKLNLTGWKLLEAIKVSADGMTIVGNGEHNGHDEAWVAHLDRPVNAPAGKERGK